MEKTNKRIIIALLIVFLMEPLFFLFRYYNNNRTANNLYKQAFEVQQTKEYGRAIDMYNNILKEYPNTSIAKTIKEKEIPFCISEMDKKIQEPYAEAEKLENEEKYEEAIKIYEEIIVKYHPMSAIVNKIKTSDKINICKQKSLDKHNIPIILKAVDSYPSLFSNEKMGLGKAIIRFYKNGCEGVKIADFYYDYDLRDKMIKAACNYKVNKWKIENIGNNKYSAEKIVNSKNIYGGDASKYYKYNIDVLKEEIIPLNQDSCLMIYTDGDFIKKEYGSIYNFANASSSDIAKRCALKIKLKGIKKNI